ncbi:unnamed protein product [Orchesella dallaii]|uniref:Reverse transcriptase zinc-binding domain-containing protein n=1 Tax=Orchesella dallaii TaxID=48710 RepID=A0ABP1R9M2_9HEXA
MGQDRYARKCFDALCDLDNTGNSMMKYNWASQVKACLTSLGLEKLWDADISTLYELRPEFHARTSMQQREIDIEKVRNSERLKYYENCIPCEAGPAEYLKLNLPFHKSKMLSQARLNGNQFYCEKFLHQLDDSQECTLCNAYDRDSLEHFFIRCKIFAGTRSRTIMYYIHEHLNPHSPFQMLLNWETAEECNIFYTFIMEALRLRRTLIEES